ncbi:HAMP domain-containing sensor histidine kinase [Pedobacter sp. JY14-1]|uniref:sensor histidine kinase n=1 Tax=Pedobacter sp. JY14-1 TaxID=3034151 RepID=UPI0023E15FF3|nr:HAMP domain-containing sensor histidine kinase [Pedobacter sp. JY14-1]
MKKRSLWLISTLMTVALLGVFVMQLYYIKEAYNLKSQLFEQNVNEALNDVVSKVQKRYAASHISKKDVEMRRQRDQAVRDQAQAIVDFKEKFKEEEARRRQAQLVKINESLNIRDSILRKTFLEPRMISEDEFQAISGPAKKDPKSVLEVRVDYFEDEFGNIKGQVKQQLLTKRSTLFAAPAGQWPDSVRYLAFNPKTFAPITVTLERITPELASNFKREDQLARRRYEEGLKALVEDTVMMEMNSLDYLKDVRTEMMQVNVPLEKRIGKDELDALLKKELLNRNISINYDFWLKLANKDSLLYRQASDNKEEENLASNTYKIPLFGNDIFRDPGMLFVSFPNKNALIIGNMWITMASSAGLLLVLIFIFTYTIYAIIRQKKISEMKTDFINNMTHEFKTPVATIMIASEALKDPEIVEDKKRINRLAGIIYDENVRLGNHIERVLSIARLEKKELKLEEAPVDMNELIVAVADSMSLQLQKKEAVVTLDLKATDAVVKGDELHLSNVIYNLIDNANKYSIGTPKITISTRNTARKLQIDVADEGIGMTKEQSRRIFDQFYRVPTGNLHDVKGFGLGLNYVQDILQQMGGTIKVHSEKDKGTKFEISIPLNV